MSSIKEKYRDNITAHWDFRLGSLSDQSGNGWDATLTGVPSFGRQKGRTLKVDADTEGLSLGKILGTAATVANMTVVVSATPGEFNATNRVVKKFTGAGSGAGSLVLDYLNTGVVRFLVATSGDVWKISSTPAGTIAVGEHAVFGGVFNGTDQTVQVFANGISSPTVAFTESIIPLYDYAWELAYEGNQTGWGDYSQVIVFDIALTEEEMGQIYEEMQQEPHYDYTPDKTTLPQGDFSDSNLIAGYDMVNRNGTIVDCTGGGDDGTVTLPATQVEGVLGKAMMFYGSEKGKVTVANAGGVDNMWPGGATFMCWANLKSAGGTGVGRIADKSRNLILVGSLVGGFLKFRFRHDFVTTNADYITTNAVIPINTPTHLAVKYTATVGSIPTFYVNGKVIAAGDVTQTSGPSEGAAQSDAGSDLILGSDSSQAATTDGWLSDMRYYSGELTDAQIATEYAKAKGKLSYYADGKDWNESVANVTAGYIENSDWLRSTGTWQVDDSQQAHNSSDLVLNGGFDTDTIWSTPAPWTIGGGVAHCDGTQGAVTSLYQESTMTLGKTYQVTFTVSGYVAGGVTMNLGGYHYGTYATANGTYVQQITISNILSNTRIYVSGNATFEGDVDNVKVEELKPDGRKQLTTVAAGISTIQTDQAFGTWEFDIFHSAATNSRINFIATSQDAHGVAGQDGYMFTVLSTERLTLHRNDGVAAPTLLFQTDQDYVAPNVWTRYKITRNGKTFTCYFSTDKGVTWQPIVPSTGTNPVDDDDYVASSYCVLNLGTLDAVRNFKFSPIIL